MTEMTSTFVHMPAAGYCQFWRTGYVIHRKDLSDLASPYLEAVQEARRIQRLAKGEL